MRQLERRLQAIEQRQRQIDVQPDPLPRLLEKAEAIHNRLRAALSEQEFAEVQVEVSANYDALVEQARGLLQEAMRHAPN